MTKTIHPNLRIYVRSAIFLINGCYKLLRFKEEFGHYNWFPRMALFARYRIRKALLQADNIQRELKFGRYNVPQKHAGNLSLGQWCTHMRTTNIPCKPKGHGSRSSLSQDRIERLEEIGFQWMNNRSYHKY